MATLPDQPQLQEVASAFTEEWQHMMSANVLRITHDPDAFDQAGAPPAIVRVEAGGGNFSYANNGWLEAASAFALHDASALDVAVVLDLGEHLDASANILSVALERHTGVAPRKCYSGEPLHVRVATGTCACMPCACCRPQLALSLRTRPAVLQLACTCMPGSPVFWCLAQNA
jgi:hypothetical protein